MAGTFSIAIPTRTTASTVRYPQFVSPNAASVTIVENVGAPRIFDISPTSPLCTASAGARTCSIAFTADVGTDTFTITIYSGPGGSGSALATASATTSVVAGTPFSIMVAMNAILGTLVLALQSPAFGGSCPNAPPGVTAVIEGCPGSATIVVSAFDPSGAPITGSQSYVAPLQLSSNDPALAVAPSQITAPGQTATLTYAGAAFGASITNAAVVSVSAGGQTGVLTYPLVRQYLYVVNTNTLYGQPPAFGGDVEVFAYGAAGNATPARVLSGALTQISSPLDIFVDSTGSLYVLDNGPPPGGTNLPVILVFAPGATGNVAPIRTIANIAAVTGNQGCEAMTRDPTGTEIFVLCDDSVDHVFPVSGNGNAAGLQLYSLQDAAWGFPVGQFLDPAGNLYVADAAVDEIFEYTAPLPMAGTPSAIVAGNSIASTSWPAAVTPSFLAMDHQGNAFAMISYQNATAGPPDAGNEVAIWRKGRLPCNNCAPSATLSGTPLSIHLPEVTAEDAAGNLYVDNSVTSSVSVIAASTVSGVSGITTNPPVLRTFFTSANPISPVGMAVGP